MSPGAEKARLAARIESRSESLVELCRSLVRIDSTNPPGDTAAIVEAIEAVLDATAGIEHRRVIGRAPAVNLVARVRGAGPGRRLVLNGHLDTFPIGEARWLHPPLGADLEDRRIDGRMVAARCQEDETEVDPPSWKPNPCPSERSTPANLSPRCTAEGLRNPRSFFRDSATAVCSGLRLPRPIVEVAAMCLTSYDCKHIFWQ